MSSADVPLAADAHYWKLLNLVYQTGQQAT